MESDHSVRTKLTKALGKAGYDVRYVADPGVLTGELAHGQNGVLVAEAEALGEFGSGWRTPNHVPVIAMTEPSGSPESEPTWRNGAYGCLPKPVNAKELVALVNRALSLAKRQSYGIPAQEVVEANPEIVGSAMLMQEVFRAIGRLAYSSVTVLLNGESGTGKELVARALHRHSPRAGKPFIALNMAAIPRDLLESELFGHERGAFTGALTRRVGRFEQANGGTLFLDEIGDMPLDQQTRLLRVLADGELYPVGAHTPLKVDVRIIAATHQNLEQLVAEGRFRADVFHRLNVIRIHLPALRERRQDIPLLLQHFLRKTAAELGVEPRTVHPDIVEHLCGLQWEGNVRQLENVCRWLTLMAIGQVVHMEDLPIELQQTKPLAPTESSDWVSIFRQWAVFRLRVGDSDIAKDALEEAESTLIEAALQFTNGHRQRAAKLLGYGRNTLSRKIKELNLEA
ncbi:nitrogen regulation protein NR(I) [Methylogaea oryzae]|uniref:DNA-binding transcriptional regulator NtrC n=2 Tax=Methylogaea oryzae TaxID=1295382 RepID=A0A8D4VV80_9GAMM|nr:nitrogen regulation protein NR(I) [Methylogaea oryzae]BBL72865.1 nitrogen regulation protein NR(I) [Methylogaea oryzae]